MVLGPKRPTEIEMSYWKDILVELEREKRRAPLSLLTISVFLLLNLVAFLTTGHYALLWTLSSLLFCVFSILFIVMPTTRRTKEQEPEREKVRIGTAKILEQKKVLGLAFWNAFFINSQPMAFGIIALFSIDIPLILLLTFVSQTLTLEVAGLLLLQSGGMILFYIGIIRMKPYDSRFLEQLWSVGKSVSEVLKGGSVKKFRTVFYTALLITVFVVSLVAAMLMPGSSVKMIRGDSNIDLANEVVPLLIIFLSQFLLVRETQSFSSRRMAEALLRKKLSLMEVWDNPKEQDLEGLERQMPTYFKVVRHDILGYMPVYMMNPDLAVILGDESGKDALPAILGEL